MLRLHILGELSFEGLSGSLLIHPLLRGISSMSVGNANHSLSYKLLSKYSASSNLPT